MVPARAASQGQGTGGKRSQADTVLWHVDLEEWWFHDLESLNVAILESLEKFNAREPDPAQEIPPSAVPILSRENSLRPLPPDRYQMRQRDDIAHGPAQQLRHAEQAPLQCAGTQSGQNAWRWVYDTDTIRHLPRLYPCGHASSQRYPVRIHYQAVPQSAGTQGELREDLQELLSRAAVIDNICCSLPGAVIEDKRYPELAFRACRGIMNLEKSTGRNALGSGCAAAMDARRYSIRDIDILESGADADYLPGSRG